jgi:hypothetical protein
METRQSFANLRMYPPADTTNGKNPTANPKKISMIICWLEKYLKKENQSMAGEPYK